MDNPQRPTEEVKLMNLLEFASPLRTFSSLWGYLGPARIDEAARSLRSTLVQSNGARNQEHDRSPLSESVIQAKRCGFE